MQTLKTAFVVVLLLVLLYGVYVVLSKPDAQRAASDLARHLAPSGADAPESPYDAMEAPWEGGPPVSIGGGPADAAGGREAHWADLEAAPGTSSPAPRGSSAVALAAASSAVPDGSFAPPAADHAAGHQHGSHARDEAAGRGDSGPQRQREAESGGSHSRHAPADFPAAGTETDGERPAAEAFDNLGSRAFGKAMRSARGDIQEGKYRDALYTLSIFYNSPDLTPEEHSQLLDLLDPLAGEVVYSRRHLLGDPYEARRNETLRDIAQRFQVPWRLLGNINGVDDPDVLVPGTEIKVVPGPFRAEVDLGRGELTVFLGRLYAGRFPVTFGKDPVPEPGSYEVRDKRTDRAYFAADDRTIAAGQPGNPYGKVWLDLGREMCIHGTPSGQVSRQRLGCISLSPRDAEDVFGILSVGSQVLIR